MGTKSAIEWTDATPIIDRGGRRIRFYHRKYTDRPGTQERRKMAMLGLRWCHGCQLWLSANEVKCEGACRPCLNAQDRARYELDESFREARKAHRDYRRRRVQRMPEEARALVLELFDGRCCYCGATAECWDHFVPITKGGKTVPGNMVPACRLCNSRKRNKHPLCFLEKLESQNLFLIEYAAVTGII